VAQSEVPSTECLAATLSLSTCLLLPLTLGCLCYQWIKFTSTLQAKLQAVFWLDRNSV